MYNEALANAILKTLERAFPVPIGLTELKKELPERVVLPDDEWLAAIDALEKRGLLKGALLRAGYNQVPVMAAKLEITESGRCQVKECKDARERMAGLEKLGDLSFGGVSETLYDDVDKAATELVHRHDALGNARSRVFANEAAQMVFERFKLLQDVFVGNFVRLLENTEEGVTRERESWLRDKLEKVWERELARAKGVASHVCQVTGLSPSEVLPQVQEVEIRGRELKQKVLREIEIAALSQEIGARGGRIDTGMPYGGASTDSKARRSSQEDGARKRKVFVIHGRDERLRRGTFDFLRSIGLEPMEWNEAIQHTGKASPYIGEILEAAFTNAQAVVALFTPDDEARLRSDLLKADDLPHERGLTGQARQNVLFEAGMALASQPERTALVQIGDIRPFSDVGGRHLVRMDNSVAKRQELAVKLKTAGCDVNLDGVDWHTSGDMRPPKTVDEVEHPMELSNRDTEMPGGDITHETASAIESDLQKLNEAEKEAIRQLLIKGEVIESAVMKTLVEKGILKGNVLHIFYNIESLTGLVWRTGPFSDRDHIIGYRGRWAVPQHLAPVLKSFLIRKD